jgi:SAC3 family protein LENG8/THP3
LTGTSQDDDVLVGSSTALEKPYFRLTTFPKPENVRPQPILVQALAHIKSCFIRDEDFDYANEQLKSVRQDITVQRLRNKFVLEVYETHARILLEHGDLDEFNQCQTMIRNLTTGNINDTWMSSSLQGTHEEKEVEAAKDDDDGIHNGEPLQDDSSRLPCLQQTVDATDEFRAYGLLYALVQNSWGELTRGLHDALEDISPSTTSSSLFPKRRRGAQRRDPPSSIFSDGSAFRHAVQVVKAAIHHDYQAFFRLYDSAPHLSAYLMDFLVRRVREAAYERIIAAYRPTMSVEHFREALFLQDLEETRRFLQKSGAVFLRENGVSKFFVDCKASASSSSSSASST